LTVFHNPFDQASKDMCRETLEPDGFFESNAEAGAPTQLIDGWFIPDPSRPATRDRFGLFGELTRRACTLEPFHATPDLDKVSECIRKLLNFRHVLSLRKPPPPLPWLWILSSGRPAAAIEGFGFQRAEGWPDGIYQLAPAFYSGLLVVSELPKVRATLFLRLMGAGKTFKEALAELKTLPKDAPERAVAEPVLLRYRLEVPSDPAKRTSDDEEFLMSTHDIVEAWKREQREEGQEEGIYLGLQKAVMDTYEARFGAMPAELSAVVQDTRDEGVLRAWLKLIVTGSAEEIGARLLSGRPS
jgi:hypothetical protein